MLADLYRYHPLFGFDKRCSFAVAIVIYGTQ